MYPQRPRRQVGKPQFPQAKVVKGGKGSGDKSEPNGQSQSPSQPQKQQVSQVQKKVKPRIFVQTRDDYNDVERLLHKVQKPFTVWSEPGMFNSSRNQSLILKEAIIELLRNETLDISCILWYQMMLHSYMRVSEMENKCAFVNPQEITATRCKYDDEHGTDHVTKHLVDVMNFHENKQFFLAPYWEGDHWMLLLICPHEFKGYILDSKLGLKNLKLYRIIQHVNKAVTRFKLNKTNKAKFSPTVWSFSKCNQQEGGWECGYYVMCWMHEFVLSRQFDFPNSNWKDDGPYSDEQLERRVNSWVNSFGNEHLRFC